MEVGCRCAHLPDKDQAFIIGRNVVRTVLPGRATRLGKDCEALRLISLRQVAGDKDGKPGQLAGFSRVRYFLHRNRPRGIGQLRWHRFGCPSQVLFLERWGVGQNEGLI
jgi:hypothetical protein